MDPVGERFFLFGEVGRYNLVCFEHELFNHLVGDVAFDSLDLLRNSFIIDQDHVIGH